LSVDVHHITKCALTEEVAVHLQQWIEQNIL